MTINGLRARVCRIALATFVLTSALATHTQAQTLPAGWASTDIGATAVAGSTQYSGGTFTLKGAGEVGGTADAFQFAYRQVTGDVTIHARVASIQNVQQWSKAGVMVRASLAANAAMGMMFISGSSGSAFHKRVSTGAWRTSTTGSAVAAPYWVRLERRGTVLTASQSSNGVTWVTIGTMTLSAPTMYVGLAVASAQSKKLATGVFDNVLVEVPAANQPPTVSLTGPANGATFTAPATMTVSATAGDADGSVTTVEFYAGTTLIGADTTSPYSVSWSNVPAGTYSLTAVARDDDSATTTSAARSITVTASNQAPTVSLTAPANGATFTAPATITTTATASDIDGTVTTVEFYAGATPIGSDTTSPYSVTWSNVPAGTYSLTAVARDNAGATTTSAARTVTVSGGLPAGWTAADIGGPSLAGSTQYSAGTYTLNGAGEVGGTSDKFHFAHRQVTGDVSIRARVVSVQTVQPWSKAGVMMRETLAANAALGMMFISASSGSAFHQRVSTGASRTSTTGTAVAAPYWVRLERRGSVVTASQSSNGTTWTTIGTMTMSQPTMYVGLAVASADTTALATGVFDNVVVETPSGNQPPIISLTSPANGATYTAPANIALAATASDADGTITRVDFYAGATLVGTDSTSPYAATWSGVAAGSYAITAVALDNAGAMTVSAARDIRVDPASLPRTAVFTASANHATAVDRYFLEIFPAGANPLVANPVATRDIGKPPVVNGECTVDVSSTTVALPPGSYIATLTAIGSGGSARSAASPAFVR